MIESRPMETMRSFGTWMSTLHVLAAIWFASGVFGCSVLLAQVKRAQSAAERVFGMRLVWRLTTVFVVPGVLLAGLLGFYLVTGLHYGFGPLWVKISVFLYLFVLAGVLFYQVPAFRQGAQTGTVAKGPAMLTHIVALAIVIMVILMAMKPA